MQTLDLPGLSCDKRDIKRLKDATLKYKTQMDNKEKFMKEARYRELRLGLKTFDRNRVNISQILDSGFYGVVYRVEYDNKSWALKILREASSKPDHKIAAGKDKKGSDEQKELSPHADDLLYEAAMLHRAAGSGVIQLRAVDVNHETPCMLTEYMCFLSVEKEFQAVDERNDETSIFHPNNPNNVHEREHKLVEDPILLQMVRISRDVATALARIHAKGIIHLDISARNIFLDASKRPKIGDFGCATMECDMKEQYEWRKKKLDAGDYTTSDTGEFLYDTEVEMEKLSLSDDSAIRKFKMSMMDRPVRYMPHWVVNCGSPPNPLIDSHCDVYAFGCFM